MASGVFYGTAKLDQRVDIKLEWSSNPYKVGNRSSLTQTLYLKLNTNTGQTESFNFTWVAVRFPSGNFGRSNVTVNLNETDWTEVYSITLSEEHNDDGTLTFSASGGISTLASHSYNFASLSGNITLPPISRNTVIDGLSCDTAYFDGTYKIAYTPKGADLYTRLSVLVGNTTVKTLDIGQGQAVQQNLSISFTESELAKVYGAITSLGSGAITFILTTFKEETYTTQIGETSQKELTQIIPTNDSTRPTGELVVAPKGDLPSDFAGMFIQQKTKAEISLVNVEGKYGASIVSREVIFGGNSVSVPYVSDIIVFSGEIPITAILIDSRGISTRISKTIVVEPYSAPKIVAATGENSVIASRCDEGGNISDSGTYLRIKARRDYTKTEVNGEQKNFCRIRYRYKTEGGAYSDWSVILASDSVSDEVDTGALLGGALDIKQSYVIQIEAVDTIGGQGSTSVSVSTEQVYLHKCGSRRSLGIGKYAEDSNTVDIEEDITVKIRGDVEFLSEKWTSLGLSSSVSKSDASVGRIGGSDCAYLVRAGGRHIFVAFNCSVGVSGAVTVNANTIPTEYRPSADIYGLCPAGNNIVLIRINTSGNIIIQSIHNSTDAVDIEWIDGYVDYWI